MTFAKFPVLVVGLVLLGGCCFPMKSFHKSPPRHHAGGPAAAHPGDDEGDAPQEYIMQEQPSAAPAQPNSQTPE